MRGTILGVPITRIIIWWGLCCSIGSQSYDGRKALMLGAAVSQNPVSACGVCSELGSTLWSAES